MTTKRFKRVFCFMISMILIFSSLYSNGFVSADETVTNDGFVWSVAGSNKAYIIGYRGSQKIVTIPSSIEGNQVTAIQVRAFEKNSNIEQVIIPEGVEYICQYAFTECTGLKSVEVPGTVSEIQLGAFDGCTSLSQVKLHEGVTTIAKRAFFGCSALESIELPEGVKLIDNVAFQNCTSLKTIILPETLEQIGSSVFVGCTSFESTTIYENVKDIGAYSFYQVPESAVINVFTLDVAKKLQNAGFKGTILGAPVENPEDYEYRVDSGKAYVTKYTGSDEKISIPAFLGGYDVCGIDSGSFQGCGFLKNVYLPAKASTIGESAFENCTSLEVVSVPEDFSYIGSRAFYGCTSLKQFTIPYTVTYIGKDAFAGISADAVICVTVDEVETLLLQSGYKGEVKFVPENDPNDYVYLGNANAIIKSYTGSKSKITIPDYVGPQLNMPVTGITTYAFSNKQYLVSVIIPESVSWIGEYAFSGSLNITKIQLPEKLMYINNNCFENCQSLKEINIGTNVVEIKDYAFRNCYGLEEIVIPEGVETLGTEVFADNK